MKKQNSMLRFLLLCMVLCGVALQSFGQNQEDSEPKKEKKERRGSILALPIFFYTPETRFAFGAAALYAFRFKNEPDSSRVSNVQLGFSYTQNKQILSYLPWRLYWNNEKYLSYGEVGYYRYNFFYFGIGNDVPLDYSEIYDVTFPRVQFNFLRLVRPNFYLGLRYRMDANDITGTEPGGELASGEILGSEGGVISGLGFTSNYDTRDLIFNPTRGDFFDGSLVFFGGALGSDFNYTRLTLDYSHYFPLPKNHVIAVNAYTDLVFGDAPFTQLALLGGTKKMRGYYQGRYRDDKLWLLQAEYRLPLFWRLGVVGFGSWGGVAKQFSGFSLNTSRVTYGGGIRFRVLDKDRLNIRVDYGRGKAGSGWYITVGEAF